jgi:hypothetical protein
MLAGADSIDDLDSAAPWRDGPLVRWCPCALDVRNVLARVHPRARAAGRQGRRSGCWPDSLQLGCLGLFEGSDAEEIAFLDVDDTVRQVHGYAKQGAAFGYSGVRGLNLQLATISDTDRCAGDRPRPAPQGEHRIGYWLSADCWRKPSPPPAQRASPVRSCARADSAYYGWAFVGTAIRHKTWFSVTARMNAEP